MATLSYWVNLDNYDPAREEGTGTLEPRPIPDDRTAYILTGDLLAEKDIHKGVFLLDNGSSVTCWYAGGWSIGMSRIYLYPFPVNVNDDGTPRLRADRPEQVDYASWALGPRRAYHLKIRETKA